MAGVIFWLGRYRAVGWVVPWVPAVVYKMAWQWVYLGFNVFGF